MSSASHGWPDTINLQLMTDHVRPAHVDVTAAQIQIAMRHSDTQETHRRRLVRPWRRRECQIAASRSTVALEAFCEACSEGEPGWVG